MKTTPPRTVGLQVGGAVQVQGPVTKLRQSWEETAFELEKLQCAGEGAAASVRGLVTVRGR